MPLAFFFDQRVPSAIARALRLRVAGDLVVPEKCWFIWPASISIQANNFPGVPTLLKRMALVEEAQIIGRPCQRWFWRRQTGYEPVLQP